MQESESRYARIGSREGPEERRKREKRPVIKDVEKERETDTYIEKEKTGQRKIVKWLDLYGRCFNTWVDCK